MISTYQMLQGEHWWGGSSDDGNAEPFDCTSVHHADYRLAASNQTMPLYVSDCGRYLWSENAFAVTIENGCFTFDGAEVVLVEAGGTLCEAYLHAMQNHFPFSQKKLPERFFRVPQYNTWMQFTYEPTQQKVLQYAHELIEHGFEPGILTIDEGWHGRYGVWEFDKAKFPNPRAMVDELHALGFTVMLWVVPYICPDGQEFLRMTAPFYCKNEKHFLRNEKGEYALIHWWNGYSAILDMTNPADCENLHKRLRHLMQDYGVDGFKFDGGDVESYSEAALVNGPMQTRHTPGALNLAWNEFGMQYDFHEFKDTWKGGGKAVIQRLRDRCHTWKGNGLDSLIPAALVCSMIGHPYLCPDMVGGGEWLYRDFYSDRLDEELFVRMAQASALFPMMQFSWAPWEALNAEYANLVLETAKLHRRMGEELVSLLENARLTGEPVLRPLEYNDPKQEFAEIKDEFMLGTDILVAPVLEKGQRARRVAFPQGVWQEQNSGKIFMGRTRDIVEAPLSVLPWFRRIK